MYKKINLVSASFALLFAAVVFLNLACSESIIEKNEQKSYTYLALGDSYTIGQSVETVDQWPRQLSNRLTEHGQVIQETKIIARTGWRTDDLLNAAKSEIKERQFDLVSLLIGVNNEFQGRSLVSFEEEFERCLDYAIERSKRGNKGVFVLSIPDYGFTPFGDPNRASISPRIDAYNEICHEIAMTKGVPFLDITPLSRKGLENSDLVASDGLHPSALQYKLWVDLIEDEVLHLFTH